MQATYDSVIASRINYITLYRRCIADEVFSGKKKIADVENMGGAISDFDRKYRTMFRHWLATIFDGCFVRINKHNISVRISDLPSHHKAQLLNSMVRYRQNRQMPADIRDEFITIFRDYNDLVRNTVARSRWADSNTQMLYFISPYTEYYQYDHFDRIKQIKDKLDEIEDFYDTNMPAIIDIAWQQAIEEDKAREASRRMLQENMGFNRETQSEARENSNVDPINDRPEINIALQRRVSEIIARRN